MGAAREGRFVARDGADDGHGYGHGYGHGESGAVPSAVSFGAAAVVARAEREFVDVVGGVMLRGVGVLVFLECIDGVWLV